MPKEDDLAQYWESLRIFVAENAPDEVCTAFMFLYSEFAVNKER